MVLCDANNRTSGWMERDSSIVTIHQPILWICFRLSWPNITFFWFVRLHTLPTLLLVIFGCSQNWKWHWKGIWITRRHYAERNSYILFPKRPLWNASNIGGTASRNVCSLKESTQKEIRVSNLRMSYCIFPDRWILFEQASYINKSFLC